METFIYKVKRQCGRVEKGTLTASLLKTISLSEIVEEQGGALLSLQTLKIWHKLHKSYQQIDLISFFRDLNMGLSVGLALTDALGFATPRSARIKISIVIALIKQGKPLSYALKETGLCQSQIILMRLQVAEETGDLQDALTDMCAFLKWQFELKAKIKKTLGYPLFILTLTSGLCVFLLMYVLPHFVSLYEALNTELPRETQFLLGVKDYGIYVGGIFVCVLLGIAFVLNTFNFQTFSHVNVAVKAISKVRFLQRYIQILYLKPLAFLYKSQKISLDQAMDVVHDLFPVKAVKHHFHVMTQKVRHGSAMNHVFVEGLFLAQEDCDYIRVSEGTNQLNVALQTLVDRYEHRMMEALERLTKRFGPGILMAVGGIIIMLIYSLFAPLYGQLGTMGI